MNKTEQKNNYTLVVCTFPPNNIVIIRVEKGYNASIIGFAMLNGCNEGYGNDPPLAGFFAASELKI